MADILIRDVPEHVVAALDARARRLGLSRSEYIRRQLAAGPARRKPGRRAVGRADRARLVRITTVTWLEMGFLARSADDLRTLSRRPPLSAMPVEYLTPAMEDRAVAVQIALADRGHHRVPSISDLLAAAAAELSGLTVLHFDKDFELIAAMTGQPMERLDGGRRVILGKFPFPANGNLPRIT
jgi:predicted nucleic acid-binding protein